MRRKGLLRLSAKIGRILRKNRRVNEPLAAFRDTESFKQLEGDLRKAIVKQGKWVAKNIHDIEDIFVKDGLTDDQWRAEVADWLNNHMPPLWDLLSQVRLYTYFHNAFVAAVKNQYVQQGIVAKGVGYSVDFSLSNPQYIAELKNLADYLIHRSKLNETTIQGILGIFRDARLNNDTIDETATQISDQITGIAEDRAFRIANTESNRAMSMGQMAFMQENDVPTKSWVGAGPHTCPICEDNEADGEIGIDEAFSSGDTEPPAHPSCECYLESGKINLDNVDLWSGD